MKNTYATSHVKGDGQVVVIEFDDRVRFELLPCFENDDGSFTYPDSHNGGRWKILILDQRLRLLELWIIEQTVI